MKNKRTISTNRKNPHTANTDVHLEALGDFLTNLRTHLTDSAVKKGTYADYLRLLEVYREERGEQIRDIVVSWIDNET